MATHELKCWPDFYDAIQRGDKKFEVRKNDRGFQKGDTLRLKKWSPEKSAYVRDSYTNSQYMLEKRVKYVLSGMGIEPGYVVLGF